MKCQPPDRRLRITRNSVGIIKMKLIAAFLILAFVTTIPSVARFISIWTYEELAAASDTILILSVEEVSKRTGKQDAYQGKMYDAVLTKFRVEAKLKGEYDHTHLSLHHLCYPVDIKGIYNGWGFKWFSKRNDTYLAFLKEAENGSLIPVAGNGDLGISILSIAPDVATSIESLEFKWTTNSPDRTAKMLFESGATAHP